MMTESRPHLLLVDDELSIREPLGEYLETHGFRVTLAANATEARSFLITQQCDVIISDIMMPGEDGLSLTRHIRASTDIPVILLTAKAEETERIIGLEVGADDYVVKPFSPRELVARIKVALRRRQGGAQRVAANGAEQYMFGDWVLKVADRALVRINGGDVVPLSTGEFNLLHTLLRHPGQVMSRERLLDLVRGREADVFDRAIDNIVSRLRRKIEVDPRNPVYLKTVWGGGYSIAGDVHRIAAQAGPNGTTKASAHPG